METFRGNEMFDEGWLNALAEALEEEKSQGLYDLYLEKRQEICLERKGGILQLDENRNDGAALRLLTPKLHSLMAVTGINPRPVASLFPTSDTARRLSRYRTKPMAFLKPPKNWRLMVEDFTEALKAMDFKLRILLRAAVIVLPNQVHSIGFPALIRLEMAPPHPGRLLSVWAHRDLTLWRDQLLQLPPRKQWQPPSGQSFPVLFREGSSSVLFHELAGHLLEGDLMLPESAGPGPKVEDIPFPSSLQVIDDPLRFDMPGAFTCDDEGIPSRAMTLIDGGRVCGALCDRESARRLGRNPGRGRRARWNSPPQPRMSNLVVRPGILPPDEMESGLRSALVISRLGGASVDLISGRVQLWVKEGWEIRRGKRRRALAPFYLGGSVGEILAGIHPEMGNDSCLDWRLGWCLKEGLPLPTGAQAPSILINRMEVL